MSMQGGTQEQHQRAGHAGGIATAEKRRRHEEELEGAELDRDRSQSSTGARDETKRRPRAEAQIRKNVTE